MGLVSPKRNDFFYRLGRKVGGKLRTGRWVWSSLMGSEQEALAAEYKAGRELARGFEEAHPCVDERLPTELLERVRGRLCQQIDGENRHWAVRLIALDEPGAFALPGGFVYVTQALVDLCHGDEHELACVVGHEMTHVLRGHAMDRITNQVLTSAALRTVRIPGGLLSQWALNAGVSLLHQAYSRDCELLADELGTRLADHAGYDPRGAIRVFERLLESQKDRGVPLAEYFASHPPLAERIARVERKIQSWK